MDNAILLAVLVPIALYILARIVFSAYFASKAQYLKKFFHTTHEAPNAPSQKDDNE